MKNNERLYQMPFADVYPHYIAKAQKKGRLKQEVDELITWLTGYSFDELKLQIERKVSLRMFFEDAPYIHDHAHLITGTICGMKIAEIDDPLMKKIRYLDKLIDELAKGKPMSKILR